MRTALVLLLPMTVGCGRIAFDPVGTTDAGPDGARITYRDAVMADHPLGYWRLADTGTTAVDEVGVTPGTYVGNCQHGVTGALAGDPDPAVQFDGTCFVKLGDTFAFGGLAPYTIELWEQQTRNDAYQCFFSKQTRDTQNPIDGYLLLAAPGVIYAERVKGTQNIRTQDVPSQPGDLHHLAVTYDGASIQLYVDALPVVMAESDPAPMPSYTADAVIGGSNYASMLMDGVLDEIAVYGVALTQAQLALHVEIGRNGPR